jgi:hypothetical protein
VADSMLKVEITGFEELIALVHSGPEHIGHGVTAASIEWAVRVLDTSQQYVPVKTGALRDSGRVEVLDGNATGLGESRVAIIYDKHYALDQHDNLDYIHPNGGQAHYVTRAVHEHLDDLLPGVSREILVR